MLTAASTTRRIMAFAQHVEQVVVEESIGSLWRMAGSTNFTLY